MDPRLLKYYNRELQYIREMGAEFAQEFPKIAGRLGLEGIECADPYVERLLEGFAFLAGRVQLRLDAEFPRFTQQLLEAVYPHYLASTPSMTVVRFEPDLEEGGLAEGFPIPRGSVMHSLLGKGDQTACEYRTAHDVKLWPLEVTEAEYLATAATISTLGIPDIPGVKAGIRLELGVTAGLTFDKLGLERLPIYLHGSDSLPMHLLEQMVGNAQGMIVRPTSRPPPWLERVEASEIRSQGFDDRQALLPVSPRSFQGYRMVHEYFAFPQRYMLVELGGLGPAVRRCVDRSLEIVILLNRGDPVLENVLSPANFLPFCTPAINLFPKDCDRIHLTDRDHEYHIVPDRTRPLDFEVYGVEEVTGYGTGTERHTEFRPLNTAHDVGRHAQAYYTLSREPRVLSTKERRGGPRSSYIGGETYVSLVDAEEAPYRAELRQLGVRALCTNRDLPLHMPVGKGKTDFSLEAGAPQRSIRCVSGPTRPRPSWAHGDTSWRLISHLGLNYLSLMDNDEEQGAVALRELLGLYGDVAEATTRKQIEGIKQIRSRSVTRRMPVPGPIAFGRGLEITLELDEDAFEGTGVFLLGAVLEQFFAKYVSINSFTQTVIRTTERGEIMRWPLRTGLRPRL